MNSNIKSYKPTKCNICGGEVRLLKNKKSKSGYMYKCMRCGASVGTFEKDKEIAMGVLADSETRIKRVQVHRLFDRFWRGNKTRKNNYIKLAEELGIEIDQCHFALMDLETLNRAEQILLRWWREKYDK